MLRAVRSSLTLVPVHGFLLRFRKTFHPSLILSHAAPFLPQFVAEQVDQLLIR